MTFGNGVVERCVALIISGIQGTLVLKQKQHHGRRTGGSGAVDGILATAVTDTGGCWGLAFDEEASDV